MREREEEIRNINKGMHTVNEIYKDLAHIVGSQQDHVDQIENQRMLAMMVLSTSEFIFVLQFWPDHRNVSVDFWTRMILAS